ncbi:MAG TPA: DUF456 domain-containing protein [Oceanobacillus sp.]|nr:DUF456 domain-containing protein [Oceanobacillus sp.]
MEIAESALVTISVIVMVLGVILAFVPILPGALIVWAIGIVSAWLTQFERVTPVAAIVMTILMVISMSSDYWLPMLGVKTSGLSCLSAIGSIIGGLIGTFVIPIPIVGTLIGTVLGALILEYVVLREKTRALRAGQVALKLFVIGYILELVMVFAIVAVFLVSIASTG